MIRNPHKREYNKKIRVENKEETFNVHFYKISELKEEKLFCSFYLLVY